MTSPLHRSTRIFSLTQLTYSMYPALNTASVILYNPNLDGIIHSIHFPFKRHRFRSVSNRCNWKHERNSLTSWEILKYSLSYSMWSSYKLYGQKSVDSWPSHLPSHSTALIWSSFVAANILWRLSTRFGGVSLGICAKRFSQKSNLQGQALMLNEKTDVSSRGSLEVCSEWCNRWQTVFLSSMCLSTRWLCSVWGLPLCGWAVVAPKRSHFTTTALAVDRGRSRRADISQTDLWPSFHPMMVPCLKPLSSLQPILICTWLSMEISWPCADCMQLLAKNCGWNTWTELVGCITLGHTVLCFRCGAGARGGLSSLSIKRGSKGRQLGSVQPSKIHLAAPLKLTHYILFVKPIHNQ